MFPPDIAHDLFKSGVVNHCLALVLSYLIFHVKLLSLPAVKKAMKSFIYARNDRVNTPPVLNAKGHKVVVKGTFSQCWTLLRVLPFMIGPLVPHGQVAWLLVVDLLALAQLQCAPRLNEELLGRMQLLVEKWLKDFRHVFPDFRLTPKFHYMLHYQHWAMKLGSLRKSWTMRFEAKHQEFKVFVSRAHNTKNVCKTLAVRHQEKLASCEEKRKTLTGRKCAPSKVKAVTGWDLVGEETHSTMAVLGGQKYCADDVLIVRNPVGSRSGDLFLLADFFEIDTEMHVKVIGRVMQVKSFDQHYMAYHVTTGDLMVVPSSWIFDPCPLGVYSVQGSRYVPLRYQIPGLKIALER